MDHSLHFSPSIKNAIFRVFYFMPVHLFVFASVFYLMALFLPNTAIASSCYEIGGCDSETMRQTAQLQSGTADQVNFLLTPVSTTVTTGSVFTLTLQLSTGTQPVDAVDVYLDFNPTLLQVEALIGGTALSQLLLNQFNNEIGTVDFAAGTLIAPFPTGSITIFQIRFRAIATGSTVIDFHTQGSRITVATYAGELLPATTTNAHVTISNPSQEAASVTVSANPTSIVANGTSQSTIVATVRDANNNPVSGATVSFATTRGTVNPASATTNANGQASATLTSSTSAGTATVTASTGGVSGQVNVAFTTGSAASVTVSANPASIVANGTSQSTIVATVRDANNNPVSGATVSFATTRGAVNPASATTNANGQASATLTSSTSAGAATVTASTGGVNGQTTVAFTAGSAPKVSFLPIVVGRQPASEAPLLNGNFDEGDNVGWTEYSLQGWDIIMNGGFPGGVSPHSGQWAAWLGGAHNEISYVRQIVTIPTETPILSYWIWIASEDVCGYDFGGIVVNDTQVVDDFDLCEATSTASWTRRTTNLGAYGGQNITLQLRVETDDTLLSNVFIDDVAFTNAASTFIYSQVMSPEEELAPHIAKSAVQSERRSQLESGQPRLWVAEAR